ncbi:MAG: manganese ABC transporter ATP-binding protein [Planctomycetaceae bacterium]|nr:MAG: manganese ABC transporter ATP-binding protein [Planctomycetaceae bacterium]
MHLESEYPLRVHDLTVAYHRRPVLWNVDYEAQPGRLVGIVGPNGAGKSTLLRAVVGLVPRLSGEVRFWGRTFEEVRLRVAYVPQRAQVDWDFPVTVLDVVTMGYYGRLGWFRPVTRRTRQLALEALERVGLVALAQRQIRQLSGGQQQRVFVARALVQAPDLYLMDEPFAGVDAATEQTLIELLRSFRQEGRTAIIVHHDLHTINEYFDDVVLLNTRVIAAGPVSQVFTAENLRHTYAAQLPLIEQVTHRLSLRAEGE